MTTLKHPAFYAAPADGKPLPTLEERDEAKRIVEADPLLRDAAFRKQAVEENSRGGVHELKWVSSSLTITVSKLREQSNGDLRADFDVKGQSHDTPFNYFTRINLKSGQTRASTARDIAKTAQGFIGGEDTWRYVIERTCSYVRRAFNDGEEGVELVDSKASTTTTYRLWPYLQERQPTVLYGPSDTGKSFFGVLAGYLIATGREHLGMKPQQGNVCYLDYETDEATTKNRLNMVAAGFGEDIPHFFHYMHMRRPLEDEFDRVSTSLMKHSIDFVVIDSAGRAVLEPESSGPVNQYFNALSGLECTTLTVAHVSKTGKESEPFGSIFWYNGARALYRAFGKQTGSVLSMALRSHKANNGPRLSERAYDFTFGDNKTIVTKGDTDAIPALDVNPPMHKRIVTYLENNGGPVTASDLAKTLSSTKGYITTVLL